MNLEGLHIPRRVAESTHAVKPWWGVRAGKTPQRSAQVSRQHARLQIRQAGICCILICLKVPAGAQDSHTLSLQFGMASKGVSCPVTLSGI